MNTLAPRVQKVFFTMDGVSGSWRSGVFSSSTVQSLTYHLAGGSVVSGWLSKWNRYLHSCCSDCRDSHTHIYKTNRIIKQAWKFLK